MSGVNTVYLLVMNYLVQRWNKLSNAYHTFSMSSSLLTRVGQRFYKFVPAFQKLSKGGTETVQTCDSCCVSGFYASITLVFILGVELFDYVVDGGICKSLAGGDPNREYGLKMGGIKPSGHHDI